MTHIPHTGGIDDPRDTVISDLISSIQESASGGGSTAGNLASFIATASIEIMIGELGAERVLPNFADMPTRLRGADGD